MQKADLKVLTSTAYENAKFNDMIRNMPVRDYNDLAAHLKERLPSASEKTRPDHEYSGRTFVGKSHTLLERVLSFASYSASFSLFAIVKAKVFLLDRPRREACERLECTFRVS